MMNEQKKNQNNIDVTHFKSTGTIFHSSSSFISEKLHHIMIGLIVKSYN